jgi:hypothetical protein
MRYLKSLDVIAFCLTVLGDLASIPKNSLFRSGVKVSLSSWFPRRQCKGHLPILLLNDAASAPPALRTVFPAIGILRRPEISPAGSKLAC